MRAVLDGGLFDQGWVEAQLGTSYPDAAAAAAAYLDGGPDLSPHPLVEPDFVDAERPDGPTHPLLDLDRAAVREWVAQAGPGTPLPVRPGLPAVTWAEFRRLAVEAATRYAARPQVRTRVSELPEPSATPRPRAGGTPLVTVIVATRARARALRRTVASVQAQSLGDWELLVADEGSGDDTPQVLTGIAAFDDRVVPLTAAAGGPGRARNEALARARGQYVAFLEPGHTWTPGFLATMVDALEGEDLAMAHAGTRVHSGDTTSLHAFEGSREHLLVRGYVDLDTLVVRTDALRDVGGFDEELGGAAGQDLVLRLAARHPLRLVPVLGADRTGRREPARWTSAVLDRHLVDLDAPPSRVPGRTSVVVPQRGSLRSTREWVRALRAAADPDLELVLVGAAPRRSVDTLCSVLAALTPAASYTWVGAEANDLVAQNLGAARATGERLVLVRTPGVRPDLTALGVLAGALDDPDVALAQPLLLDERGLIRAAGAVFGAGGTLRPVPFLAGHAARDARDATGLALPAAYGPVVAVRAETLDRTRGLDPAVGEGVGELDLALRAAALGLGRTVLEPRARVGLASGPLLPRRRYLDAVSILEQRYDAPPPGSSAAWAAVGFQVVGHRHELLGAGEDAPGPQERALAVPHPVLVPSPERLRVTEGLPRLRWTIDLAAPPGAKGEAWGDTHFARSLAAALERLGQHVAVDPRQARHRATRDLDDVLLVVRGLDRVDPRPAQVSLAWVISHPDLVDAEELAAFDAVFAASTTWSAATTARTGVRVEPLLQCTDPALFHPAPFHPDPAASSGPEVLFVGNSRGIYRSAVRTALAVGAPLTIHGAAWEGIVDPALIASRYVPNSELGALYASAGVVLNDHWEDMRRDGFVSNRLFDAAATGARIVTDDVPGLAELFGGLAQPYRGEADMRRLLAERETAFPSAEERRRTAARVAAEHSFDARARTLAEAAARRHAQRAGG